MSKLYTLSRLHLFFMLLFYAPYLVYANDILVDYRTLEKAERLPLNIDLLIKNLEVHADSLILCAAADGQLPDLKLMFDIMNIHIVR